MGTIAQRKRADGTTAYTAQIRLKDQGVIVHTQAQTFTKKALAQAWLKRREAELQVARATCPEPEEVDGRRSAEQLRQADKGNHGVGSHQNVRHQASD